MNTKIGGRLSFGQSRVILEILDILQVMGLSHFNIGFGEGPIEVKTLTDSK
jgi:hypothetical protein